MISADLMQKARIALRTGQLPEARRLLRQVIHEDPQNHAAWLLLAQATPDPKVASEYVRRAEMLRPDSPLVQQAQTQITQARQPSSSRFRAAIVVAGLLLLSLVGITFGRGAWQQASAGRLEPSVQNSVAALPTLVPNQADQPARVPATTISLFPVTAGDKLDAEPTAVPASTLPSATRVPTAEPATAESADPLVGDTADTVAALPDAIAHGMSLESLPMPDEQVEAATTVEAAVTEEPLASASDVPEEESIKDAALGTAEPLPESGVELAAEPDTEEGVDSAAAAAEAQGDRWIDVNLSTQSLVAYEGQTPVFNTLVSTGMWNFPTVTGDFHTYLKYESQDMNGYLLGYDYYIQDVPYVMYFYEDYAIHGAYWHNNFGTPMSHGCVNVSPTDAGWLYDWAPLGTLVSVHY